jgi:hypothetical protein
MCALAGSAKTMSSTQANGNAAATDSRLAGRNMGSLLTQLTANGPPHATRWYL